MTSNYNSHFKQQIASYSKMEYETKYRTAANDDNTSSKMKMLDAIELNSYYTK